MNVVDHLKVIVARRTFKFKSKCLPAALVIRYKVRSSDNESQTSNSPQGATNKQKRGVENSLTC